MLGKKAVTYRLVKQKTMSIKSGGLHGNIALTEEDGKQAGLAGLKTQ